MGQGRASIGDLRHRSRARRWLSVRRRSRMRMASLSALLGASLAWLLVLTVSCAAGAAIVFAWQRWGGRLPLPDRVQPLVVRMLGAPVPTVAGAAATKEETGPPPEQHPKAPRPDGQEPRLSVTPGGAATAEELAPHADEPDPDLDPEPEPETVAVRPKTSRTDAIEELTAIFGVAYDEAVALFEAGLWGLDNHEEWTRSVRQGAKPDTVPAAVVDKVLARSTKDIGTALEAFRTKRKALRELESLWGVGPEQAEALFAAGFEGREAIRRATTEKLSRVDGIGRALAFQIRAAAHDLAPTP